LARSAARSVAQTERSEADSLATEAMAAWLRADGGAPPLAPMELAEWLRLLPANRVRDETKRAVARRVLEQELDGCDFHEIVTGGRWAELAVDDEREAAALARLFRQKQREATMAEAARQNARQNSSLKAMRGEMLTV